jgi:uncharacterized membrane protein
MEKTWQLDQREAALVQQMEQERQSALAMVGALTLDMRTAEKNLEASAERQRAFVRQALMTRGIDRYENARLANGALVVTVPDAPPLPPGPVPVDSGDVRMAPRLNGAE